MGEPTHITAVPESGGHIFALPVGTEVLEYKIRSVLGHGGFGITYLAVDTSLQETVAIKEYFPNSLAGRTGDATIRPKTHGDEEVFQKGLEAFLGEARLIARFHHPNIMQVRRFFHLNGTGYIVLGFIEGQSLDKILKSGPMEEKKLRAILDGLLDGLETIHERAILHRDLKPGNIIVRPSGVPVLIDFGAARDFQGRDSQSITAIASPGYAPPEQYGAGGQQGPWTDLYALGAIAYRAVTGQPPADSLKRLRKDPLIPASRAAVGYSAGLLNTIDWMLNIREEKRPQSAAAVRKALSGMRAATAFDKRKWAMGAAVAAAIGGLAVIGHAMFATQGELAAGSDWQSAIAKAAVGSTLRFQPGIYHETLTLDKNITLVGNKQVVFDTGDAPCALLSAGTLEGITLKGNTDCVIVTSGSPRIRDIAVASSKGNAVIARGDAAPELDGVAINSGQHGLRIEEKAAGHYHELTLKNLRSAAIYIKDQAAPELDKVAIIDTGGAGILVAGNAHPQLRHVTVSNAQLSDMEVRDGARPDIADSELKDGKQSGIFIHSGGGGDFHDNTITGHAYAQITVQGESEAVFSGNKITGGLDHGVYVTGGGTATFEKNTIAANAGNGIAVDAGSHPTLNENTLERNKDPQLNKVE